MFAGNLKCPAEEGNVSYLSILHILWAFNPFYLEPALLDSINK
jgi:hypothetical protein